MPLPSTARGRVALEVPNDVYPWRPSTLDAKGPYPPNSKLAAATRLFEGQIHGSGTRSNEALHFHVCIIVNRYCMQILLRRGYYYAGDWKIRVVLVGRQASGRQWGARLGEVVRAPLTSIVPRRL